jgi:hypothetical protein
MYLVVILDNQLVDEQSIPHPKEEMTAQMLNKAPVGTRQGLLLIPSTSYGNLNYLRV